MKRLQILALSLIILIGLKANNIFENAKFSLLTVSPSTELYTAFGHSGIRLIDTTNKIDVVYNWGTFDFNTPNFYLKFATGKLNYTMAVESFESFMNNAFQNNRSVKEQVLNLSIDERAKLAFLIERNYDPENRNYKYDFLYDNCATRIRDIILNSVKGKFMYLKDADSVKRVPFRQLFNSYMISKPWTVLGIDIVLGSPADSLSDVFSSMFLPDKLYDGFAMAQIQGGNQMVIATHDLYIPEKPEIDKKPYITPVFVMWLIFIIGILLMFNIKANKIFDIVLFHLVGTIGLLISLLWMFSDHQTMHDNFNLIWALPTHLVYFLIVKNEKIKRIYFTFVALLGFLFCAFWSFIPQGLNIALLPIVMILAIKALNIVYPINRLVKKSE